MIVPVSGGEVGPTISFSEHEIDIRARAMNAALRTRRRIDDLIKVLTWGTMKNKRRAARIELLFLIGFSNSCGRDSKPEESSPIVIAPPPPAAATQSDCPHTGKWAVCSVERRLRQSGFVMKPVETDTSSTQGLSVKPLVYTIGRARVQIFIYDDEAALAKDIARVDTTRVNLIRSGNLVAIYLGDNPQQAERLSLAITAGAPQPGSPR